ncbi:hypothetical protein ABKN59_008338 [Abortiporus biennis]
MSKLPLVIRKSLRDNWESKKPDFETKFLYQLAVDKNSFNSEAKTDPGAVLAKYSQAALDNVTEYVKNYGDSGKSELNALASKHEIILIPAEDENKCSSGGVYCSDALQYLNKAVNEASKSVSPLSLIARENIKKEFDPKIGSLRQKFIELLQVPDFTLDPNFKGNAQVLNKAGTNATNDWETTFGETAYRYFERIYQAMERDGFGKDDMLQEGFQEAVEMNKMTVRITEKLEKMRYNEVWINEGVFYIQTTPDNWGHWIEDLLSLQKLEELL